MSNISNWSAGQGAISAAAITAILMADLVWQKSAFQVQEKQIKIQKNAAVATADNTKLDIEKQADATEQQAIGEITSGSITGGASLVGVGYNGYKEDQEVSAKETQIKNLEGFKTEVKNTPVRVGVGRRVNGQVQRDKATLLQRGSHQDQNLQGGPGTAGYARRQAAFSHMKAKEKALYLRNANKDLDQLSEDRNHIQRVRQGHIQSVSAISQAASQVGKGAFGEKAAEAQLAQAQAKYAETIAQYISQSSSIANQMLQSQASDAIAQKRAALDMESQITSSQMQGSAA